jgi:hypothetical protein
LMAVICGNVAIAGPAMVLLMYMGIGGSYPYILFGGLLTAIFVLMLAYMGKQGMIDIFGSKAETH